MKNLVKFVSFFLIGIVTFIVFVLIIPDQYEEIYQRSIVKQYEYLKSTDDSKVIFVGNSSLMFGLDLDEMDKMLAPYNKKSVLLGGHVSYGLQYFIEMTKDNIKRGDVVVIEFPGPIDLNNFNPDLLLTGIGKKYEMYKYFPKDKLRYVISRYPKYVKDNLNYFLGNGYHSGGPYSMEAMDYRGSMVIERGECEIPMPYDYATQIDEQYQWFAIEGFVPNTEFVNYLNEYTKYCENLGVKVLFTVPVYLDESVLSSAEDMDKYDESWAEVLAGEYVSHQRDYIFSREFIFNQSAHLNSKGALLRTDKLYEDIKEFVTGQD